MELIMLPQVLAIAYGALILGCGGALGFTVGRNARSSDDPTLSPGEGDDFDRRLGVLEEELGSVQAQLDAARDEAAFYRRLTERRADEVDRGGQAAA